MCEVISDSLGRFQVNFNDKQQEMEKRFTENLFANDFQLLKMRKERQTEKDREN